MEKLYLDYLFRKHVLVHEDNQPVVNAPEVVKRLKADYDITVIRGAELADDNILNFDKTIKLRKTDDRNFEIVTEETAMKMIEDSCFVLMNYSDHITNRRFELLKKWLKQTNQKPAYIKHTGTFVKLLVDTRDMYYARFVLTKHILAALRRIVENGYEEKSIKRLNLKNSDRKFVERIIRAAIANSDATEGGILPIEVKKKKKDWNGLLHHIHFVPYTDAEKVFTEWIRR